MDLCKTATTNHTYLSYITNQLVTESRHCSRHQAYSKFRSPTVDGRHHHPHLNLHSVTLVLQDRCNTPTVTWRKSKETQQKSHRQKIPSQDMISETDEYRYLYNIDNNPWQHMPNLSSQPPQFYLTSPAGGVQVQSASTIKLQPIGGQAEPAPPHPQRPLSPQFQGEFTTLDYIISRVVNLSAQITARASQLGQAVLIHSSVSSLLSEGPGPYSTTSTTSQHTQYNELPLSNTQLMARPKGHCCQCLSPSTANIPLGRNGSPGEVDPVDAFNRTEPAIV
ncbi:uncharacterized protein ACWYII_046505 isoform 1-T1 [Salvelinus alpinus]